MLQTKDFLEPLLEANGQECCFLGKAKQIDENNQVHGAEEYRIPTMETFKHKDQEKLTTRAIHWCSDEGPM